MQQGSSYSYSNMGGGMSGDSLSILVDPRETIVDKLSSSPLLTFLMGGGIGKDEVFFTEKRLYVKQGRFTFRQGFIKKGFIVDMKDISATSIMHVNPVQYLVYAVIAFILGIICAASDDGGPGVIIFFLLCGCSVVGYFIFRGVQIYTAYPGHWFRIRLRNCSYQRAAEFHKKLRSAIGL